MAGMGVMADEYTSNPIELTDNRIISRADFFIDIYSSFLGETKITVKSYSTK
jgi:hypothetical protein